MIKLTIKPSTKNKQQLFNSNKKKLRIQSLEERQNENIKKNKKTHHLQQSSYASKPVKENKNKNKIFINDIDKRYQQLVQICTKLNQYTNYMDPLMCTDESIEDLVTSKHNNKAKDQTCKSYRSALPPIQEDLGEQFSFQEQYIETARNHKKQDNSCMRSTTADYRKRDRSQDQLVSISPFSHNSSQNKIKISVRNLVKNKRKVKSSLNSYR